MFLEVLSDSFNRFVEYELKQYPAKDIIFAKVNSYINRALLHEKYKRKKIG